jgi:hypothetical protein
MTSNAVNTDSFLYEFPEASSLLGELNANKVVSEAVERLVVKSWSLAHNRLKALEKLQQIQQECSVANWDGEDADPISSEAITFAAEFIARLPIDFPMPELTASSKGEVVLDWIESQARMATVYLAPSGHVLFAWVYDGENNYGSYTFAGRVDPRLTSVVLRLRA